MCSRRYGSSDIGNPGKDRVNHLSLRQRRRERPVGIWMERSVRSLDVHR